MESDDQEWLLKTNQGWAMWSARSKKCPLAISMRSQGRSVARVHVIPNNMAQRAM